MNDAALISVLVSSRGDQLSISNDESRVRPIGRNLLPRGRSLDLGHASTSLDHRRRIVPGAVVHEFTVES